MDTLIEEYLRHLAVERGLAENSLAAYGRDLRRIVGYLKQAGADSFHEVSRVRVACVLLRLREEGLSPRTISRHTSSLRGLYRYLLLQGRVQEDPTAHIESSSPWFRLPGVLSQEEVERLLAVPPTSTVLGLRDKAMLELLYAAGLRVSEMVTLRLSDVDLEVGYVRCQGKGGKDRVIPLGRAAQAAVRRYLDTSRLRLQKGRSDSTLFLNRSGYPLTRQGFW